MTHKVVINETAGPYVEQVVICDECGELTRITGDTPEALAASSRARRAHETENGVEREDYE